MVKTIYVDGGMNKQTGLYSYASVVDENGEDMISQYLFLFEDFELKDVSLPVGDRTIVLCKFPGVEQQNNGAELIAAICGIRLAIHLNINIIYSDSLLIINYWSKSIKRSKRNEFGFYKYLLINLLINLNKAWGGKLVKIAGKDNLADLGYHR